MLGVDSRRMDVGETLDSFEHTQHHSHSWKRHKEMNPVILFAAYLTLEQRVRIIPVPGTFDVSNDLT